MKKLLLAVTLLVGFTQASLAGTVEQQLINSLRAQGYLVLEQSYTFLGRLRILAVNGTFQREIVVNPGTGEILRDTAVSLSHNDADETAAPNLTIDSGLPATVPPVEPEVVNPEPMAESSVGESPVNDVDDVAAPYVKEPDSGAGSPDYPAGADFAVTESDQPQGDPTLEPSAP